MTGTPTPLPRRNPPKASEYATFARVLAWVVYLGLGFFARVAILALWIFMDLLGDAFDGWVVPVLGFLLVPWTTLTFSFMWIIGSDNVSGWEWIVVAGALLVDYVFWAWTRSAFK